MNGFLENRELRHHMRLIVVLTLVVGVVLLVQFTNRSPEAAEVERAQIMLKRIYDLEVAYFAQNGVYLPIDEEHYGDVLFSNASSGVFRYRVVLTDRGFTASAHADLDGNGRAEIWQVDVVSPDPVLVQED